MEYRTGIQLGATAGGLGCGVLAGSQDHDSCFKRS